MDLKRSIGRIYVTFAWAMTGHVCDRDGTRVLNGKIPTVSFLSINTAKQYCGNVLKKRPFLECYISTEQGHHIEIVHSETPFGPTLTIESTNHKFTVCLSEWTSYAKVSETGKYLSTEEDEPVLEFNTYKEARSYCKSLMANRPNIAPWIYDREGKVVNCGGFEVLLDSSEENAVSLPWWRALIRKLIWCLWKL